MKRVFAIGLLGVTLYSSPARALDPLSEAEDRRQPGAPALQEALRSEYAVERARAAEVLGRIQRAEGISALLALVNDPVALVRRAAVFALGQFGWDASFAAGREEEIAGKLLSLLPAGDLSPRVLALEALGKMGLERTPEYVVPFFKDPEPKIRAEAVTALYRYRLVSKLRQPSKTLPDLDAAVMGELLARGKDASVAVRRAVAYYFYRVKDARGLPLLVSSNFYHSVDRWTRFYLFGALGRIGVSSPHVVAALNWGINDPYPENRLVSLEAMAAIGAADRLAAKLVKDPSASVRAGYAKALGSLPEAADRMDQLGELIRDSSVTVQIEAYASLVRLRPAHAFNYLEPLMGNPSWVMREALPAMVKTIPPKQHFAFLKRLAADPDARVRASAVEVLGSELGEAAFDLVQSALRSSALAERGSAVSALGMRKEPDVARLAGECLYLSPGEKWIEIREELVKLLSGIAGAEATRYLEKAAQDPASSVARLAIQALKERGSTNLPPLPEPTLTFSPYREARFPSNPVVTLETTRGPIEIELFAQAAPIHVANFVGAAGAGVYDGSPFHRVVPGFVVQGGDPDGSGWGSGGYSLRAEIGSVKFDRGTLGMPRSTGFDTGGIQLFITHVPTPHLEGQYTAFGRVVKGMEVVDNIERGDLIIRTTVRRLAPVQR